MEQMENKVIEERMRPLNEIKVVFLGDAEAGKSHIISRLMADGGEPMAYVDLSTPGIAIRNKEYDLNGSKIQVHYWDFGGQEILHSMHRIFLTERTLYVVVVNARDGACDKRAEYWLQSIACYAPNAPVVLVLNKYDQNPNARVNDPKLAQKYRGLKQILKMSARNMSAEVFNNEFTHILLKEIQKTGCLDEKWPESWLRVKKKLENTSKDCISYHAYRKMCLDCQVRDDPNRLLKRLHELGVSFSLPNMEEDPHHSRVVLRPDWITNALYILLINKCEGARNGLVPHKAIYELLKDASGNHNIRSILPLAEYGTDDIRYILTVTRKFKLSFLCGTDHEFIPALCQQDSNVDIQYLERDSATLEFHMEFDYLPNNLLYMLMVERHGELDINKTWRTGTCFHQKENGMNAIAVIEGNVLQIFIRSTDAGHATNTHLAELKADVDRLANRMGLEVSAYRLIYKLDGKREPFDYEELKIMLDSGETRVYSRICRRMIPITDILNQLDPDEHKANRLVEDITRACWQLQSIPHHRTENAINQALRFYLPGSYIDGSSGQRLIDYWGMQSDESALCLLDQHHSPLTVIETLKIRCDNVAMRSWDRHLTRLLLHDSSRGLSPLFLISFVDCDKAEYAHLWNQFRIHMQRYSPERGRLLAGSYEEIDSLSNESAYLKIARCRYYINGRDVTVYSYFVRVEMVPSAKAAEEETQHATAEHGEPVPVGDEAEAEEVEILPEKADAPRESIGQSVLKPGKTTAQAARAEYEPGRLAEKKTKSAKLSARESLLNWLLGKQKKPVSKDYASGKIGRLQVLKECRVVFLGDSEAGKSLIMSRVENPKMDPAGFHGNTTIGINIFSRIETVAGQPVRVNYWDFGGQEILHSMHRMFLGEKTLYVIILNTRNDNQDTQADFWLRYVEAYAPHAPVMLVMNKIDQNKRASLNLTVLRRHFTRELDDSNVLKISAVEKDPEAFQKKFKDKLIAFIAHNAHCIHNFSPVEAQIRDEVEQKKEKVFRAYDFLDICRRKGITAEKEQYDLMNRFNEAGIMVSFGTKMPMFLNPKWITSLIYKVLDQGDGIADNGVVSDIQLSTICENNPAKWKGAEDADFLLRIMQDYDLAFICRKQGTNEKAASEKTLIPMLCRREEPKAIQELIQADNPVEMRMVFEYLPGGVLYKLMADCNREHGHKLNPDNLWLTGIKFENETGGYTIVRQEGNTMALYVHDISKSDAVNQLVALSEKIEYIAENEKFNARLNETKISYPIADVKEYFDYQQLLNTKESGVGLVTSTRKEARSLTEKPPKIPVLDIFDQDEGKQKREAEELLRLLLMGCVDVQKDKVFWDVNENARNRQLARALRVSFTPRDQTQGGTSGTGNSEGELDIEILNEKGMPIAILEALNTTSINTANWRNHLDKLMDNYNTSGLRYLILTSYIKCPKKEFDRKFKDTANHWNSIEPRGFEGCLEEVGRIMEDLCPELIRVTRAVYSRNNFRVSLYHFMVHIGGDEAAPEPNAANQQ